MIKIRDPNSTYKFAIQCLESGIHGDESRISWIPLHCTQTKISNQFIIFFFACTLASACSRHARLRLTSRHAQPQEEKKIKIYVNCCFTLEDKLVSSKHLISALGNFKSLCRKRGFTLVDKVYYQKSVNLGTAVRAHRAHDGSHFLLVKCVLKCGVVQYYLRANFGFFELRTFHWSPSKVEVGTFQSKLKVGFKYPSTLVNISILEALV